MDAKIVNYRRGRHTEYTDQYILSMDGVSSSAEAAKYVGKAVAWVTPTGNRINGRITHTHGNAGAVLARFEKGLPGQALGSTVQII
jgi:large subunit ribosomal protein L35Ae